MSADVPGGGGLPTFQFLAKEAREGRLAIELDPAVAQSCAAACNKLVVSLLQARTDLQNTNFRFKVGDTFDCGRELSEAIYQSVMSTTDGLNGRLAEHIEIVHAIRDMIKGQVAQLTSHDSDVAAGINNGGK